MKVQTHLAFLFPGQGSQAVGMLSALVGTYPEILDAYADASEVLGYDLWEITSHGPEEKLSDTRITQPAVLTASVALWRLWVKRTGISPGSMAGHSLGEYSALVCAGAITFSDAVKLVEERGRLMQSAMPAGLGSMAAVLGLDDEEVIRICAESAGEQTVSAANFNSPGQIVISGHKEAVERAVEYARAAGAKRCVILPVSVPSHCALMQGIAPRFREALDQINLTPPQIPVIHNVDVLSHDSPETIKEVLVAQLYQAVRWTEIIQLMKNQGIIITIECGPGKVLSGLVKKIDRQLNVLAISEPETFSRAMNEAKGLDQP